MRIYLINLERRPDRLAAMTAKAEALGLALTRVEAVDAATAEPGAWIAGSPMAARWARSRAATSAACCPIARPGRLSGQRRRPCRVPGRRCACCRAGAGALLARRWLDSAGVAGGEAGTLRPAGPARAADGHARDRARTSRLGRMLSRHTGAAAYILSRRRGGDCCWRRRASTCRWIICCSIPTIRRCSRSCRPGNCCRPSRGRRILSAPNPISRARAWACATFELDLCEAGTGALRL